MRCRCSEISRCSRDISTLGQMIRQLTQLEQEDSSINNGLNNLASVSGVSITPQNIGELTSSEQKLNHPISNLRSQMLSDCEGEKKRLENTCKWMQSEDRDYHRKQEEERRNNR